MSAGLTTHRLSGFDDPRLGREGWNALLQRGNSNVVFLTWEWQRAWWDSFERSGLLLVMALFDGKPVALAPFFAEEGWIYFVGSGGSDYLDFVGDVSDGRVLDAVMARAMQEVDAFRGMLLYHVLEQSETGARLRESADRLKLTLSNEIGMMAPLLSLKAEAGQAALQKKSLVRHEKFFRRDGRMEVFNLRTAEEVVPRLEAFFSQHIQRWSETPSPSLFRDETQKRFYRELTNRGAAAGWLRFTEVKWNDTPVAFHFGSSYAGTYLWYKPSFEIALARYSPGEVLLRQLFLAALDEGAHTFDFGLGDEPFKKRFATQTNRVQNFTLRPTAPE